MHTNQDSSTESKLHSIEDFSAILIPPNLKSVRDFRAMPWFASYQIQTKIFATCACGFKSLVAQLSKTLSRKGPWIINEL